MACLHRKHAKPPTKIFVIEGESLCSLDFADIIHGLSVLDHLCLKLVVLPPCVRTFLASWICCLF